MKSTNELKELYLLLKEKEISLDLLGEADALRQEAKRSNNDEYYLKATVLILNIFTQSEDNLLDDALKIGADSYELARNNASQYPDVYKDFLSQLSYIYITKQLYQQALLVENELKNYLNPENKEEVNRWQLELAYIYNAIDEKSEALRKFQAILLNEPDNETKSVCLSNLAQLYIEANDFDNAKKTLEENYKFAREIGDEEGIRYITCLKGKIYRLLKDYKNSYNTLYPLTNEITELTIENFNYLNEFINLLIDMGHFAQGLAVINKYYDQVNNSFDLADKLLFYKNALRLDIEFNLRKKKNATFDAVTLLDKISELEKEIQKNKEIQSSLVRDNELDLDSFNKERAVTNKIKDNLLNIDVTTFTTLRDFLIKFSSTLNEVIPMDEVIVALFDKSLNQDLSLYPLKEELISTYQFKNNRLYERKLTYDLLDKTVISDVINNNEVMMLDFTKNSYAYVNPFTNDFYQNEKVKYLSCYPLKNNDIVYGEIIYLSKSNNIIDYYNSALLDIVSTLFSANLKNMLYIDNNNLEHSLSKLVSTMQDFGVFYYSDNNKTYILSNSLQEILKTNLNELSVDSFNDYVLKSDLSKYLKKYDKITSNEDYIISYHLVVNDKELLVREKGIAKTINDNLYYVGTIMKIDLDRDTLKNLSGEVLDLNNLNEELERRRKTKFCALVIASIFDNNYYKNLKEAFKEQVYFNNDVYYLLFNQSVKDINMMIKLNKELLKNNYSIISYPSPLVRIDDLVGVAEYVLNSSNTNYTVFTNELYASFISVNAIESMVSRALLEDKVEKLWKNVTLDNQFVGYVVMPSIPGVYDLNNLSVISKETRYLLDKYMVKSLSKDDNISIYDISLESLSKIIDDKVLLGQSKVAFNITKYQDITLINDCIKGLKETKCRLVIDFNLFMAININNLLNHHDIILAFNNNLSDNEKEVIEKYIGPYYIFDDINSLKVSKVVNKK